MSKDELDFVAFDPKKARPVKWLWSRRIVKGGMSLLVGNEGVGKGILVAWMMAQLSKGKLTGCHESEPVRSAIIANEDSLNDVWFPRILAANGDVDLVRGVRWKSLKMIDFRADLAALIEKLVAQQVQFVYFDQLQDHMGLETDSHNNKQVRNALVPLHASLRENEITGLGTLHPNKKTGEFREIVSGAAAPLAIVRSALFLASDPNDPEYRVVIGKKTNYGAQGEPLSFKIRGATVRPNGRGLPTAVLSEMGPSLLGYDELMAKKDGRSEGTQADRIRQVVRRLLADGEWHPYPEIMANEDIADMGPSFKTMNRVAAKLGVEKRRKEFQGSTEWRICAS